MKTIIGLLGKQEVKLVGNPELIEQLAETSGERNVFNQYDLEHACRFFFCLRFYFSDIYFTLSWYNI